MKTISKLSLFLIFLLAITFTFIYITGDREEKLREEISELNALMRPQVETISKLDAQIAEISLKVESITDAKGGHVTRQDMVEIMDLNVESYEIIERRQRAECQKIVYENELRDKQKKVESLRRRFFTKIFLR
jgi:predicted  nucleic acid-binding Zn-ribbon protein